MSVYYTPTCAFSAGTITFLLLRGADFHVVNLDEHPSARDKLSGRLKKKIETPVVELDMELHVAPSLSELKSLLEGAGLGGEAAPHEKLEQRVA